MADKKDDKKEDKGGDSSSPVLNTVYWVVGSLVVLSVLLNGWNGRFLDFSKQPVEDPETGRVVGVDDGIKFPVGDIKIGDRVILKADTFVRGAPAQTLLGKQEKYKTATVQDGPVVAFNQNWWRLNFEKAPDGWVPEYSMTRNVGTYKAAHIIPITWKYCKPILWVLSIIFLILFAAAKLRLNALRAEAVQRLKPVTPKVLERMPIPHSTSHIVVGDEEQKEILTAGDRRSNERWMHILQLLQSHNQNDWRQSIIEADIILEEMLEKMGYDGKTIGDKLKMVEPSDFRTINQAWEAHKVRNRIAHMGSEFQISRSEVEKIINLYQEVFDEFYYI